MQFTLEEGYKNFQFMTIIDFYIPFFQKNVHKSSMYNK